MAQESVQTCSKHTEIIDIVCEDCDKFLCSQCVKNDHGYHKWVSLFRASAERRNEISRILGYIKKEKLPCIDDKLEKTSQQIEENKNQYETQIKELWEHNHDIVARLSEIIKHHEKNMKDNLTKKNQQANVFKTRLLEKRKLLADKVNFLEENSTLCDYSLVNHHRELKQILSDTEFDITNRQLSIRYKPGKVNHEYLEQMTGQTLNLENINATKSGEFKYERDGISVLESLNTDKCYMKACNSDYVEQVDKRGDKKQKFNIVPNDMCVNLLTTAMFISLTKVVTPSAVSLLQDLGRQSSVLIL
ncbi:tripartite motif-containing protein 75-like [Saccostrea cucullata]|uniref:tripartite motif-containing protein 75-like n=1 Tax=Saccostrea cuccullata TaxID=36930 RepID=UPI002ED381BF